MAEGLRLIKEEGFTSMEAILAIAAAGDELDGASWSPEIGLSLGETKAEMGLIEDFFGLVTGKPHEGEVKIDFGDIPTEAENLVTKLEKADAEFEAQVNLEIAETEYEKLRTVGENLVHIENDGEPWVVYFDTDLGEVVSTPLAEVGVVIEEMTEEPHEIEFDSNIVDEIEDIDDYWETLQLISNYVADVYVNTHYSNVGVDPITDLPNLPPGGQHGLHGIVPGGYPGDTYPIMASSGEEVLILTERQQRSARTYRSGGGGAMGGYFEGDKNFFIVQDAGMARLQAHMLHEKKLQRYNGFMGS